jgi:phosphohistidine phosphatase
MFLYLVRHGIAANRDVLAWPDDRERPLTSAGEQKLARAAPDVDVVLSSRLARAWQTAVIIGKKGGWPAPLACEALEPDGSSEAVLAALHEHAGAAAIGLVGHEPNLSQLAGYLLLGGDGPSPFEFKKAGVACVEFGQGPRAGAGRLRWLLPPKLVRALA